MQIHNTRTQSWGSSSSASSINDKRVWSLTAIYSLIQSSERKKSQMIGCLLYATQPAASFIEWIHLISIFFSEWILWIFFPLITTTIAIQFQWKTPTSNVPWIRHRKIERNKSVVRVFRCVPPETFLCPTSPLSAYWRLYQQRLARNNQTSWHLHIQIVDAAGWSNRVQPWRPRAEEMIWHFWKKNPKKTTAYLLGHRHVQDKKNQLRWLVQVCRKRSYNQPLIISAWGMKNSTRHRGCKKESVALGARLRAIPSRSEQPSISPSRQEYTSSGAVSSFTWNTRPTAPDRWQLQHGRRRTDTLMQWYAVLGP